jgi:hypothetical protein
MRSKQPSKLKVVGSMASKLPSSPEESPSIPPDEAPVVNDKAVLQTQQVKKSSEAESSRPAELEATVEDARKLASSAAPKPTSAAETLEQAKELGTMEESLVKQIESGGVPKSSKGRAMAKNCDPAKTLSEIMVASLKKSPELQAKQARLVKMLKSGTHPELQQVLSDLLTGNGSMPASPAPQCSSSPDEEQQSLADKVAAALRSSHPSKDSSTS